MRRTLVILLLSVIAVCSMSAGNGWMGHHVLVAYYSQTGNTEMMAERIAMLTGGDLWRIEPSTPYPEVREAMMERAKRETEERNAIEIKGQKQLRIEDYDIVFIGSPAWFGTWAAPAASFAMDERLEGKSVIPFMYCGGECDKEWQTIGKYATRSVIVRGLCLSKQKGVEYINRRIKKWIVELFDMKCEGDLTQMNVLAAIARMRERYPKITLCDVYKSFYQDKFGPGHIIESRKSAREYLKNEMKEVKGESVGMEPCGALGRYVRVDLNKIKSGEWKMEEYLDRLMNSVETKVDTAEWVREWQFVLCVMTKAGIEVDNMSEDMQLIESRWANGEYGMHHSRVFDQCYDPHYRIIKRDHIK